LNSIESIAMLRVRFLLVVVSSITTFLVLDSEAFVAASLVDRDERAMNDGGRFCVPEDTGQDGGSGATGKDPIEEQSFRCSADYDRADAAAAVGLPDRGAASGPGASPAADAAVSLHGRLLCAAQCAYGSAADLRAGSPYFRGAGFLPGTSVKRIGPRSGLDACLVGRTVDGIVVAFRGTSGAPLEWLQNARVNLREIPGAVLKGAPPGARIHAGFFDILSGRFGRGVKRAVLELLAETDDDDPRIYVTGHSKGGSLAALFALLMREDGDIGPPELVCTFGAARVGNAAFGSYYDGIVNQITYENHLDIVPFLPPGETTMDDIERSTDDPEAMMEMLDGILEPPAERKRGSRRKRKSWSYDPIGKRTYIDSSGDLLHPVPRDLDTRRIKSLEGKNLRDFRRAHCSSCSIEDDDDDDGDGRRRSPSSTCSGGYFAALAPEICERASSASTA